MCACRRVHVDGACRRVHVDGARRCVHVDGARRRVHVDGARRRVHVDVCRVRPRLPQTPVKQSARPVCTCTSNCARLHHTASDEHIALQQTVGRFSCSEVSPLRHVRVTFSRLPLHDAPIFSHTRVADKKVNVKFSASPPLQKMTLHGAPGAPSQTSLLVASTAQKTTTASLCSIVAALKSNGLILHSD